MEFEVVYSVVMRFSRNCPTRDIEAMTQLSRMLLIDLTTTGLWFETLETFVLGVVLMLRPKRFDPFISGQLSILPTIPS